MIIKLITYAELSRKEICMLKLMIIMPDTSGLADFAREMKETGRFEISWTHNGRSGLSELARNPADLAVVDVCRFDAVSENFVVDDIACEGCGI